jgi:hypothetical protein
VDATVLAYRETKSLRRARRNVIKQKEADTNALLARYVEDCIAACRKEARRSAFRL